MAGLTIGLFVLVVFAVILVAASRHGDGSLDPDTSGYISDTVVTQTDYLPLPDPVVIPEVDDTVGINESELEYETEPEVEDETVGEDSLAVEEDNPNDDNGE